MAEKRKDNKGRNLLKGESQRTDGRYVYQYTDASGKRRSFYAKDLPELRDKEKKLTIDIYEGIDSRNADKITVDMLFDKLMDVKKRLRETTRYSYTYHYQHYIQGKFGSRSISSIKASSVETFYNGIIDKYSPSTLSNIHKVMHSMFDIAVQDDLLRKNPSEDVMRRIRNSHDLTSEKRIALTAEEQENFIDFAKKDVYFARFMPLFSFMLGTGCRIGEALGLTWNDVDFKAGVIHINRTLTYQKSRGQRSHYIINEPKTAAGKRDIPMMDGVRKALRKAKELQIMLGASDITIDGVSDFIFTNENRVPIKKEKFNKAIKRIIRLYEASEAEAAKKEHRDPEHIRHFSSHNIRHTFCTNLCQVETNLKSIQAIMGHNDIKTTMNVYAEATEDAKKASIDTLESKFKIG